MKKRNRVVFTWMDVYYFARCLGKDKVPESGNNPLGMETNHFSKSRFDILKKNSPLVTENGDCIITSTPYSKPIHNGFLLSSGRSSKDINSLQSIFSIDYTTKSLQPLNPRQRIKCLKDAGVEITKDQLSVDESKYLIKLRQERQNVGCKCTGNNPCDPSKCACSMEGIPCQSDGNTFPCKCGLKCSNKSGKRIYSNFRIKYHYKHIFERDLFTDISDISTVTVNGDCELCNNIDDETLQKMFTTTVTPKRKRIANNRNHNDIIKLEKCTKMIDSVPEDTCPLVVSTVFNVSSSFIVNESFFSIDKSNSLFKKIDTNKENDHFLDKSSPTKDVSIYTPLHFPSPPLLESKLNVEWTNRSPILLKTMDYLDGNEKKKSEIIVEDFPRKIFFIPTENNLIEEIKNTDWEDIQKEEEYRVNLEEEDEDIEERKMIVVEAGMLGNHYISCQMNASDSDNMDHCTDDGMIDIRTVSVPDYSHVSDELSMMEVIGDEILIPFIDISCIDDPDIE